MQFHFSSPIVLLLSLLMIFHCWLFSIPKYNLSDDALPHRKIWVYIKLIERIKCANPCWNTEQEDKNEKKMLHKVSAAWEEAKAIVGGVHFNF